MPRYAGPLLTRELLDLMLAARDSGAAHHQCSLDLGRTESTIALSAQVWTWQDVSYPWPDRLRERTVYFWSDQDFAPLQRFSGCLIKLIPTAWGAPTFEIDGIFNKDSVS